MLAIYLTPLFVGQFQSNILDQSMHIIGVRNESAIVQFKEEYKSIVDLSLNRKEQDLYDA